MKSKNVAMAGFSAVHKTCAVKSLALVNRRGLGLLQLRSEDPTLEEIYLKYFREA